MMTYPFRFFAPGFALMILLVGFVFVFAAPHEQADLRINEFMADNTLTLEDPQEPGEFPDWLELYNSGSAAVSLDNLFLTDDPGNPRRYAIPAGVTIEPGGFLVFYADNDPTQGALHLNFALNKTNGFIGLFNGVSEQLIDSYTYGAQTTDMSEGRESDGDGNWRFFTQATPGATNLLLPPLVRNVQQTPAQPDASTPVTITAIIQDDRGLAGATLFYRMTSTGLLSTTMSAVITDTYAGVLPVQPDGTLVHYYISVMDIDGLRTQAPPRAPDQTYRYAVGFQAPLLYINEIMADNESALENPEWPGEFPDWFELYNPGPNAVSLDGLFLTDSLGNPTKYAIPNGLTIDAAGYMLFYADNRAGEPGRGPRHTNFALSADGEFIGLYGALGAVLIDGHEFGPQLPNFSTGRHPDGSATWLSSPCITPGAANTPCAAELYIPAAFGR
jgi:hypothetical protein